MISHELFDGYGRYVTTVLLDVSTCKQVILYFDGKYYRPVAYDFLGGTIARCMPVEVIDCNTENKADAKPEQKTNRRRRT